MHPCHETLSLVTVALALSPSRRLKFPTNDLASDSRSRFIVLLALPRCFCTGQLHAPLHTLDSALSFLLSTCAIHRGSSRTLHSPVDIAELTELRARQRTFEGAYRRTALANLGYALTVLRLFDPRFYSSE